MKIERMFSNYEEENFIVRTGNDELDELLERAFCEGYEYAQKEFTGATAVKRGLKQLELQVPNVEFYKRNYPNSQLASKKGRIKHVVDHIHEIEGGVVGKTNEFDKSFYKAKTLSPKRKAAPRNGNEQRYVGGRNNNWEEIAKEAKVKK